MKEQLNIVKNKSRHQSIYEYLDSLQLEYVVADLRSKIYCRQTDKIFWSGIKEFKKQKINELSSRNLLPNIFNDRDILKGIEERVYVGLDYPNFFYNPGDKGIEKRRYWDLYNYYRENVEVRFLYYNDMQVGYIHKYEIGEPTAIVRLRNDSSIHLELPLSKITRIL